ncbi:alpha/beta hydrolase fold-domain-containing protein [Dendryphion nanum]|uniref:Alpha/beta hydrolase fold-domain-containing protein n=1 Tax=Dendryphion nanum TaxID=256645 RepID=A0A9P9CYM5_9PLEO|nr:alpha/beta hydrolase fold-domain-containing protein [Dendryphion nanum]
MAASYFRQPRLSREEIRALSTISDELKKFFDRNGEPSLGDFTDVIGSRNGFLDSVQKSLERLGPAEDNIEEITVKITVTDGWNADALVARPSLKSGKTPGPLIVIYHGGGFIAGTPKSMTATARGLVRLFDAVVVSATYRLAPEHKFPVGVNDAYDGLRWIAEHAEELGADTSKGFIIGGGSAGANFVPVLARRAITEGLKPDITGQWIAVPVMFQNHTVPSKYREIWMSWEQNKHAVLINATNADLLFNYYGISGSDFNSPLFNPLAPGFDVSKLPRAFVQVAGMDLVRDDGIVFSYSLDDAGVETRLKAYPGVPHTFWSFVPSLKISQQAVVDIAEGFGWLLGRKISEDEARKAMFRNQTKTP